MSVEEQIRLRKAYLGGALHYLEAFRHGDTEWVRYSECSSYRAGWDEEERFWSKALSGPERVRPVLVVCP